MNHVVRKPGTPRRNSRTGKAEKRPERRRRKPGVDARRAPASKVTERTCTQPLLLFCTVITSRDLITVQDRCAHSVASPGRPPKVRSISEARAVLQTLTRIRLAEVGQPGEERSGAIVCPKGPSGDQDWAQHAGPCCSVGYGKATTSSESANRASAGRPGARSLGPKPPIGWDRLRSCQAPLTWTIAVRTAGERWRQGH